MNLMYSLCRAEIKHVALIAERALDQWSGLGLAVLTTQFIKDRLLVNGSRGLQNRGQSPAGRQNLDQGGSRFPGTQTNAFEIALH